MKEELIFEVTKLIAESDSLAEGYHYCDEFTKEDYKAETGELRNDCGEIVSVGWRDLAIKIIELVESKNERTS